VGTRAAVRKGAALNNVLHRKLPCGLGKMLGRSLDSEDRWRGELDNGGPPAAAEARAPAIVRLGLINKRLGELLWCTRKSSGLVGVRASTGGRFALAAPMAERRSSGGGARAKGRPRTGIYRRWRSVRGSWGRPRRRCTRRVGSKARQRAAERRPNGERRLARRRVGSSNLAPFKRSRTSHTVALRHGASTDGSSGASACARNRSTARRRGVARHDVVRGSTGAQNRLV
jgi:hypothetical protein